ncbi:MAG TPA: FG-GAP-like repeat-containing protein [Longimicrobiales bacterium]|nr:FG-GAP-like repeat-containing protein [Longimicrobiales bacterium]
MIRTNAPHRLLPLLLVVSSACSSDKGSVTGPGADPPPTPAALARASGDQQSGVVGATLKDSLMVRVTDAQGRPYAGAAVAWAVASGGGSVGQGSTTSDASGHARTTWTLGTTPGTNTVTAAISGLQPVTFSATAAAGAAARLRITPDSVSTGTWGDTVRLAAVAEDAYGNVLPAASVQWSTSDTLVLRIGANGLATSRRAGQATLQARLDTVRASVKATVHLQRNARCLVPTGLPTRPTVGSPQVRLVETPGMFTGNAPSYPVHQPATGDFDGDGDEDIVAFSFNFPPLPVGGSAQFWRNVGGRFVEDPGAFTTGPVSVENPRQVEVRDFNGDGVVDLFVADHGWDWEPFDGAQDRLLLSQPGGKMAERSGTHLSPQRPNQYTHASASGDWDCDGDVDLFSGSGGGMFGVQTHELYYNNGAGSFVSDTRRWPAELVAGDFQFTSGAACDFDRDGDTDLFIGANTGAKKRSFFLTNDGFGTFRHAPQGALPTLRYEPIVDVIDARCADLDRDGWQDLVISASPAYVDGVVEVLLNRGDWRFENVTEQLAPNQWVGRDVWPSRSYLTDMNADGWLDILVTTIGGDAHAYVNRGAGQAFASIKLDGAYTFPVDANGDGRTDMFWPGGRGEDGTPYMPVLFMNR